MPKGGLVSVCFRSEERSREKGGEGESGGMLDIPPFMNVSLENNFKNRKEKKNVGEENMTCRKRRQQITKLGKEEVKKGRDIEGELIVNRETKRIEGL